MEMIIIFTAGAFILGFVTAITLLITIKQINDYRYKCEKKRIEMNEKLKKKAYSKEFKDLEE